MPSLPTPVGEDNGMPFLLETFILGCMLAKLKSKECSKLLGVRVKYPKKPWWELVGLAYSEEDPARRKFFQLCLHGGREFLEVFFGQKKLDFETRLRWEVAVAEDTKVLVDLGRLYRDLLKLQGEKEDVSLSQLLEKITFDFRDIKEEVKENGSDKGDCNTCGP